MPFGASVGVVSFFTTLEQEGRKEKSMRTGMLSKAVPVKKLRRGDGATQGAAPQPHCTCTGPRPAHQAPTAPRSSPPAPPQGRPITLPLSQCLGFLEKIGRTNPKETARLLPQFREPLLRTLRVGPKLSPWILYTFPNYLRAGFDHRARAISVPQPGQGIAGRVT